MAKSKTARRKQEKEGNRAAVSQLVAAQEERYASLSEDLKKDDAGLLTTLLNESIESFKEIIQHKFDELSLLELAAADGKDRFVKAILDAEKQITDSDLKYTVETQKCKATSLAAFHNHPNILNILLEPCSAAQLQPYAEGCFSAIICKVAGMKTHDSSPLSAASAKQTATTVTTSSSLQETQKQNIESLIDKHKINSLIEDFEDDFSALLKKVLSPSNDKEAIYFCTLLKLYEALLNDPALFSKNKVLPFYAILGFLGCYEILENDFLLNNLSSCQLITIIISALPTLLYENGNVPGQIRNSRHMIFTPLLKDRSHIILLFNEILKERRNVVINSLLPLLCKKISTHAITQDDLNNIISFTLKAGSPLNAFTPEIQKAIQAGGNTAYYMQFTRALMKAAPRFFEKTHAPNNDSKLTSIALADGKQNEDVTIDLINERNEIELKSIHAQISYLVGGADYKAPEPDIKVLAKVLHEQEAKFSDDNNKFRIKTKINNRAADLFIGKDKLNSILLAMNNVSAQQKPIVANDYIKEYIEELKNNLQNQPEKTPSDYEKTIRSTHSRLPKPPGGFSYSLDAKATTPTFFSVVTPANSNHERSNGNPNTQPATTACVLHLIDTSQGTRPR